MPVNQSVDQVVRRQFRPSILYSRFWDDGLKDRYLAAVSGHEGSLSNRVADGDFAFPVHLCHTCIVGVEDGQPSHVARGTVGKVRQHLQLLLLAELHRSSGGFQPDFLQIRLSLDGVGCSIRNPLAQHLVSRASLDDPDPPAVSHFSRNFSKEQTLFRSGRQYSTTSALHRKRSEIPFRIVLEDGQLESILSLRLPVAR